MLHRPMDRQCAHDRRTFPELDAVAAAGPARVFTARARVLGAAILVASLQACGPGVVASFDSPEPAARNSAIVRAGAAGDQNAVPDLIRMLDSDDPATRLLAIEALDRITGQRLGYEPHAEEAARAESVDRWRAFVNDFRPRDLRDVDQPQPAANASSSAIGGGR